MWPFLNNVITSCECIACTPATSICYTGVNLTCIGVNKNDSLSVALEKIDALMCVPITNSEIITALGYTPANDDNVVHKSGTETITGDKTFSGSIYFSEGILSAGVVIEEYSAINYISNGFLVQVDITPATDYRTILFPDASGTVALLENLTNYVPYTGATTNVNLGEFQLTAGQVSFDQTPIGAAGAGVLRWNDVDGTLDLGLKGGNVTLQVGQEQIVRVVNKTGANLLESQYKVVRVRVASEGGAQGQRLAVVLAQANNDADSITTLGVVTENIDNNQEGFITTFGNVSNINTTGSLQGETWVDGDVLYLSPTTPGQLTKIKPIAPQHSVTVGYVVYAHAVNGKIFIKVDNGYELDELHNVLITTPVNNDVLTYNSSTALWENKPKSSYKVYTAFLNTIFASSVPTVYLLENTLGYDITWTKTGTGTYVGTVPAPIFTPDKTDVSLTPRGVPHFSLGGSNTTTTVYVQTYNLAGANAEPLLKMDTINIKIYN